MPRLSLAVALGVGVGGALEDVSSYARLTDGLSYRWGRNDSFYGSDPGVFEFVLDNADGRFTPGNSESPLATTLTEGMAACISVGGRLTAGTVRSIEPDFPSAVAAWSLVRVTCDDVLGELSRSRIVDPTIAAAIGVGAGGVWPFSEPRGSTLFRSVAGLLGSAGPFVASGSVGVELGVSATAPGGGTQATLTADAGMSGVLTVVNGPDIAFPQPYGDGEYLGVWLTPRNASSYLEIRARLNEVGSLFGGTVRVGVRNTQFAFWTGSGYVLSDPFVPDEPYFVSASFVAGNFTYKVNGVTVATGSGAITGAFTEASITVGDASYGSTEVSIADLVVTEKELLAHAFRGAASSDYLDALAQLSTVTVAGNPNLEGGTLTAVDLEGASILDALNDIAAAEQGHLYTVTSGSLTSPTKSIELRERDRPAVIACSFDVEDDLSGAPVFVRDIMNLVSRATVAGATNGVIVEDVSLVARAGGASTDDTVLLSERVELQAWAQDRIQRGANTRMQIRSVVVDAFTTSTDRSADLLALAPGDRVRFTGLPGTQLGFDFWDGWFLGAAETHAVDRHEFELFFQPVLADVAVLDTSVYMADGVLTLAADVNASVTSMSVASSDSMVRLESVEVPYTLQIDDEHIRVTACTDATPQVLTVVRGVNGTTAAAHLVDAAVEVADLTDEYEARFFRYPSTSLFPSTSLYPTGFKPSWSLYAF